MPRPSRLLALLALAWILAPLTTPMLSAQQAPEPLKGYPVYKTLYSDLELGAALSASIPGAGIVGAAGPLGLEILATDPSKGLLLSRYTFPLSGAPAAIASDGDLGSYVAVGTSRGEVVVYSRSSGGASYIQASRYPIKSLSVGAGPDGTPYLAVLDSGGFLYIYKAVSGGWAEVGPSESTAIYSYSPGYIAYASPSETFSGGARASDPSKLVAIDLWQGAPATVLNLNIANETGQPVDGAVVSLYLKTQGAPAPIIQGRSISGTASIVAPIFNETGTVYVVNVTHPSYATASLDLVLNKGLAGAVIPISVVLKQGEGENVPLLYTAPPASALLIDATRAPGSVSTGSRIYLGGVSPAAVRLIRSEGARDWAYLAVVVGADSLGRSSVFFIYYSQDLSPLRVSGRGYVNYVLPGSGRAWIGYDETTSSVMVALDSGKAYYFYYDPSARRHVAYWSLDIDPGISAADFRGGIFAALDTAGRLHLYRIGPGSPIECTRTQSYRGVPLAGQGVGVHIYPLSGGLAYVVTQSRSYVLRELWGTLSRCPLEKVDLFVGLNITDPLGSSVSPLQSGSIRILERGEAVASANISGGAATIYIPRGSYEVAVEGPGVGFTRALQLSSQDSLVSPAVYRVQARFYYTNPASSITSDVREAPRGLSVVIDGRLSIAYPGGAVDLDLYPGQHYAELRSGDLLLARGSFAVDRPGPLDVVLTALLVPVRFNISLPETGPAWPGVISRIVSVGIDAEGPLVTGLLGSFSLGDEPVLLPPGVYTVRINSPLFYTATARVGVRGPGDVVVGISLVPRAVFADLLVIDDLGEPVPNATVAIYSAAGAEIFRGVSSSEGVVKVSSISFGQYSVRIYPADNKTYSPANLSIVLESQRLVVIINRTRYSYPLELVDPVSGAPVAPVRVVISYRNTILADIPNATDRAGSVTLPAGVFNITVLPADQRSPYQPVSLTASLTPGQPLKIQLSRRTIEYSLKIVNDLNQPLRGAVVILRSLENPSIELTQVTGDEGVAFFRTTYSSYTASVQAQGYNKLETQIPLGQGEVTLSLQPTIVTLLSRYTMAYIAVGVVASIIVASRVLRRYLERKMREEAL